MTPTPAPTHGHTQSPTHTFESQITKKVPQNEVPGQVGAYTQTHTYTRLPHTLTHTDQTYINGHINHRGVGEGAVRDSQANAFGPVLDSAYEGSNFHSQLKVRTVGGPVLAVPTPIAVTKKQIMFLAEH